MRVLAIETSCDETAIALLECTGDTRGASFTILKNELYSQAPLHAAYGGVFPTLAKREHQKNLPLLLKEIVKPGEEKDIEAIFVTQGPGLEPALWQGIEFAQSLGAQWKVPVYGQDHMEGHIVSGLVRKVDSTRQTDDSQTGVATSYELQAVSFPVLALLISGGHTELVLMRDWFKYELIGRTKDDAIGEAFDKVARLLELEYPGGPKIEALAARAKARGALHDIVFPRPMAHDDTCDFSFSGLKTAVLYKLRGIGDIDETTKEHIAEAFQDAARDIVVLKTSRALERTEAKTLAVGGGVSASREIRGALQTMLTEDFPRVTLAYPSGGLHLDNAIMIGMAGYLRRAMGAPDFPLTATGRQSLAS